MRAFVDTNILVYALDRSAGARHDRAASLIEELVSSGGMVLSTQVLNELARVLLKRGTVSGTEVADVIGGLAESAACLPLTPDLTDAALRLGMPGGLSFWDALIWAAARAAGVDRVFTEDFQHGREIGGVLFVNPFLPIDPVATRPDPGAWGHVIGARS